MAYYIDIFSPETYKKFSQSDKKVTGVVERQKNKAEKIKAGDKLICYVTRLSRWVGVLEVISHFYIDHTSRFTDEHDPYVIRFDVIPKIFLPFEKSIPIDDEICWKHLSFTKDLPKKSGKWTGLVRNSLNKLSDLDGKYLETILLNQLNNTTVYPLDESDYRKLNLRTIKAQDNKQVAVYIPDNEETLQGEELKEQEIPPRDSIKIQALIAEIGERMNFKIWLPRSDKQRVLELWHPRAEVNLLLQLPLNYDATTLKTIENIDVLWISGRSIVRAFEVEHTTSIYSGILRMADLMALQPNLNINAHIVAPVNRKEKVLQEITRPVFALLETC